MNNNKKFEFLIDGQLKELVDRTQDMPTAENYALLATACNVRGMFVQALEAAEKATELDAEHFTGWFEYSIAATTTDEKHLRKILERINKIDSAHKGDNSEIKTAMALTHYYLAEDKRAMNIAHEVLEKNGGVTHTFEVLGYISYNSNDVKAAIRHFLKALEVDDSNFRAHWMTGHCWFELDDLQAAKASYQRAVELQPHFANAWFSLGKIFLVQEEIQKAYQCFNKCLSINPRMWDCYFTQADYYLGHRKHDHAISCCQRILELDPDVVVRSEALNYIGEVYLAGRNFDVAHYYFEQTIAVDNTDAVPFNNLGVTLMKQDRIDEAIELFKKAHELDPTFAYPVTKLGQAYLFKKQLEDAMETFRKALSTDPNEYWAWLGISEIHRKNRQYRKELEAIMKAAEICSDDSDVYNYMGIAFQSLRDYDSAEKAYIRSLELDPLNRKAANNLGFLYEKFYEKSKNEKYKEKAVSAWKQRLLICRDTAASTKGAVTHLIKLGVEEKTITMWLKEEHLIEEE